MAVSDQQRRTALMVAAQSGRAEVVDALAKAVGEDWVPGNEQVRTVFSFFFFSGPNMLTVYNSVPRYIHNEC